MYVLTKMIVAAALGLLDINTYFNLVKNTLTKHVIKQQLGPALYNLA